MISRAACLLAFTALGLAARPALSQPKRPATAEGQAEVDRYVQAATALGCNAIDHPLSTDEAAREADNDRTLREHGFTRSTYARAAARFASDARAHSAIQRGLTACLEAQRKSFARNYQGQFRQGRGFGRVRLTVDASGVRGYIYATIDGQSVSIAIPRSPLRGTQLHMVGQLAGRLAGGYVFQLELRGEKLVGSLRLTLTGGAPFEVPVTLEGR